MFDFVFALLLLITLLPFFIFFMIAIRIFLGSPVFFRQLRPGLQSKPFELYKFRTMSNHRDHFGNLLSDEKRLTRFGKFLRSCSIDELPELFNILKGDMSFVGPRPLLMDYLPYYNAEQKKRHNVRPGLTGWAQINGRNSLSWKKKFELDGWYADNCSFFLDVKIILLTIVKIIKREGINAEGHATMTRFDDEVKQGQQNP